jgi:hypothetical protein
MLKGFNYPLTREGKPNLNPASPSDDLRTND